VNTASVHTVLGGGRLLAAISTSIVAILRENYGRGPMKAKTYAVDDMIVVVMRASGYTPLEQTLIDNDQDGGDRVVSMRHEFQLLVADRYKRAVEELTGRNVVAFLSQAHVDPDVTIEVFFVDGPLPGFDIMEGVERDAARQAIKMALAGAAAV